jgi:CubicO group peptidase (beta-lactamase class C family)
MAILIFLTSVSCVDTRIRSTNYSYKKPLQFDNNITTDNLRGVGIDSAKIIEITKLILADTFPNIHSLLIAKDNKLVYEHYFSGKDQNWGWPLGYVNHDATTLHDTRSISKSVVSACIGIAIGQKLIQNIDDPIFNYLPNYLQYKTSQNGKITIRHLLTMSSGMRWDEDVPHGTSKNNETQMERSSDPVAYVLEQSIAFEPGSIWEYNSGGVQVLAEIVKNVSGLSIDQFSEKYLFRPLDINAYHWTKSKKNFPAAASGLRLTSRDLLKFGMLYLNHGKWNNKQILSEKWIDETFKTQITRSPSELYGYSYLFWTNTEIIDGKTIEIIAAKGNGGQRIFICKEMNLNVVITAGNYNKKDISNNGEKILTKYIISAVK